MKRSEVKARVWRAVRPVARHISIEGKTILTTFVCKSCKGHFLISEAYIEGKGKRKYDEQIRPFCVDCWDLTKGRIRPRGDSDGIFPAEWFI